MRPTASWRNRATSSAGVRSGSAIALVLALVVSSCAPGRRLETREDSGAMAPDSLPLLEPFAAYQRGLALGEAQRFDESLPYFRRALAVPPRAWQPYCDFAITLFHATHQTRLELGVPRPVTRSSFERVAMIREALGLLDRAEALTANPVDRAYVVALRARYCRVWGLQWDALAEYHRAGSMDPKHLAQAFELADVMREPTSAIGVEPGIAPALPPPSAEGQPLPPRQPVPKPVTKPPAPPAPPTPPPPPSVPTPPDSGPSPAEPDTSNGE